MTPAQIAEAMDGLVFVGNTDDGGRAGATAGSLGDDVAREVARVRESLEGRGRELASLLTLDVYHEAGGERPAAIAGALAEALPEDCRPCLTFVEVVPGALGGRAVATQAVSVADPIVPGDGRFPQSSQAGPIVAVAAQSAPDAGDMVAQTTAVMERIGELLAGHGTGFDDAVRYNVFYIGAGTQDDWAVNARARAIYFTEPGPATTGIPVAAIEGGALINIRLLAVVGSRGLELREHSWPEGHWDWPFHLPYHHGCDCAGTTFVGGQVSLTPKTEVIDPGDLARQTARSVRNILSVIELLDKDADGILRLVAFYQHLDEGSAETVRDGIRDVIGREVELTLIGLPHLAYPDMIVEIEAEVR
jgi:enamine deaminase RidA (YjgF/YER057c/UK114 family)